MNLFCNERHVGYMEPYFSEWTLEFDSTPAMPLSPHFECKKNSKIHSAAVRHFFVNYLPEEPFANHVASRIKPYPRTMEDWFGALGQELTGAYALTPAGKQLEAAVYMSLSMQQLEDGMQASRQRADAMAFTFSDGSNLPRLSLAGAQDKFALWFDPKQTHADQRYRLPQGRAASTHIFKPDSTDARYPFLPANEYACAQLARAVGLPVAQTGIASLGGVRTLVVQRFDRHTGRAPDGSPQVRRLHQIDLCQLLNLPREAKYASGTDGVDTQAFFKACDKMIVPALARRRHLQAWLFHFVIGNHDAHAKNHSFLYQTGWHTAPLYDLLCVMPYLPDQTLSMGLLHEYRPGWFEPAHWAELARLAGVTKTYLAQEMKNLVQRVRDARPGLLRLLQHNLTNDELDFLSERVNPVVQQRCTLLLAGAQSLIAV